MTEATALWDQDSTSQVMGVEFGGEDSPFHQPAPSPKIKPTPVGAREGIPSQPG